MTVFAIVAATYAITVSYVHLPNVGVIKAIDAGVYWDNSCTQKVDSIDWGSAEPSTIKNVTVYVRNEGNTPATLYMGTANWNPANATNYIFLNWNYNNSQPVSPSQVIAVVFSLAISPNIQGITTFSFDLTVSAAG